MRQTEIGPLPEDWAVVELGDIAQVRSPRPQDASTEWFTDEWRPIIQ
ncbi:MAG: hypothetical protein IPN01_26575 [Deltaproteobacteria bacterium]|nr:hypothetical protein [Deltaproteobacteria bacterium]